ncbi:MAG: GNAT family N-acetyltransferase [Rhizobiales bacterium]|nr:GNAT family N-acetyltransferase [Hyphomicrobiales bacterium]
MIGWIARLLGGAEPGLADARTADAAAIATLHAASFRRGWDEAEIEGLLIDPAVLAQKAQVAGRVVGFILSRRAADEAEILSVAVDARRQGRGLGRRLLTAHLGALAGYGTRTVFLEVDGANASARRLYARAGFVEVGRRPGYYPQPGGAASSALVLRRDL